jgi:hypothetical protein
MMINFDQIKLKQTCILIWKLILFIFLLSPVEKTDAQISRIAVVNIADSNLIYKHIGFSLFKDKADTFDCQFNYTKYTETELTRVLSTRYTVSLLSMPDKLIATIGSAYNSLSASNEIKAWILGIRNLYDFVIFIETGEEDDLMDTKREKLRSCGIYTRGNAAKNWVAVFSTTRFTAIRTANLEVADYEWRAMDYLLPISDYQFSRQNLLIDPEMLTLIRTNLTRLIDYKIEYFITNSFLVPDVDYDNLKTKKTE